MPNVNGKTVIVLGDSLTHRGARSAPDGVDVTEDADRSSSSPGDLFASRLLAAGASKARINGRVSRSAYNLFTVEDGPATLAAEAARNPDIVFVFLGTNDLGLSATKDKAAFAKIRAAFPNADVWAIGPPSFASAAANAEALAVVKTMKAVFGDDHFIDLRLLTNDLTKTGRAGDGVHFTATGAKVVATRLAEVATREDVALMPSGLTPALAVGVGLGLMFGLVLHQRRRA